MRFYVTFSQRPSQVKPRQPSDFFAGKQQACSRLATDGEVKEAILANGVKKIWHAGTVEHQHAKVRTDRGISDTRGGPRYRPIRARKRRGRPQRRRHVVDFELNGNASSNAEASAENHAIRVAANATAPKQSSHVMDGSEPTEAGRSKRKAADAALNALSMERKPKAQRTKASLIAPTTLQSSQTDEAGLDTGPRKATSTSTRHVDREISRLKKLVSYWRQLFLTRAQVIKIEAAFHDSHHCQRHDATTTPPRTHPKTHPPHPRGPTCRRRPSTPLHPTPKPSSPDPPPLASSFTQPHARKPCSSTGAQKACTEAELALVHCVTDLCQAMDGALEGGVDRAGVQMAWYERDEAEGEVRERRGVLAEVLMELGRVKGRVVLELTGADEDVKAGECGGGEEASDVDGAGRLAETAAVSDENSDSKASGVLVVGEVEGRL